MSIPAFSWALERGASLALSPAERLVLIYLADKANGARVCWPGQETIRTYTGLALNTVRAVIRRLEKHGLIVARITEGICTQYHILRPADDATPANENGVDDHPRKSDGGTPANEMGVRGNEPPLPPQTVTPNLSKEERKGRKEARTPLPPKGGCVSDPPGFAMFWREYPRKTGKRAASQAYAAALKRGNRADDILDGLERALPHLHILETRYTPHPATWLNQDRWHDEPPVDPVLRAFGLTDDDDTPPFNRLTMGLLQ